MDPVLMGLVKDLLAPILIGSWFNLVLFTVEMTMLVRYIRKFRHDHTWIRIAVAVATVNDLFGSILTCYISYNYAITNYGDIYALFVQGVPFAMLCLAGYFTYALNELDAVKDRQKLVTTVTAFFSLAMATDWLLAISLVIVLWRHYNATSYDDTKVVLRRVIAVSIEAGVVTSAMALACLISFRMKPETNTPVGLGMCIGRLYTITLLFNLNLRVGTSDPATSQSTSQPVGRTSKSSSTGKIQSFKLAALGSRSGDVASQQIQSTNGFTSVVLQAVSQDKAAGFSVLIGSIQDGQEAKSHRKEYEMEDLV
ncbi:hypothetical protein EMMF5_006057 [Cystobasidiomycetes sp. EMM_F5]